MKPVWISVAAAFALVFGGVLFWAAYIYLSSEAVIQRRYPLPSTIAHPLQTQESIAAGKHLARVLGCFDCHGSDLRGQTLERPFAILAPNLRRPASALSDKDIVRAMRFGLRSNGTSMWIMPSASYVFLRDADMDALIAYLRSLPVSPQMASPPSFDFQARRAIVNEEIAPVAPSVLSTDTPIDLGPRYGGGRYLARTSCAECHGLDLGGSADKRVPALDGVLHYSLGDFFSLMRRGYVPGRAPKPRMSRLAKARFHDFADYEVVALYRYLYVRAVALPVSDTPR